MTWKISDKCTQCCSKAELGNFLTKLKLKPLRKRIFMIHNGSLIRRETLTASNWGKEEKQQ